MNINFNYLNSLYSNDINRNIPIFQIAISGHGVSEYYSEKSLETWRSHGYRNIIRHEATIPSTMKNIFSFAKDRKYSNGKSREWDSQEKGIWESHYTAWEKLVKANVPCIIIEHDCYLTSDLQRGIRSFPLYSFAMNEPKKSNISSPIAACGYYIVPFFAKHLMEESTCRDVIAPVDGFIHNHEPWYPYAFNDKQRSSGLWPGKHIIVPSIGTVKKKLNFGNQ